MDCRCQTTSPTAVVEYSRDWLFDWQVVAEDEHIGWSVGIWNPKEYHVRQGHDGYHKAESFDSSLITGQHRSVQSLDN